MFINIFIKHNNVECVLLEQISLYKHLLCLSLLFEGANVRGLSIFCGVLFHDFLVDIYSEISLVSPRNLPTLMPDKQWWFHWFSFKSYKCICQLFLFLTVHDVRPSSRHWRGIFRSGIRVDENDCSGKISGHKGRLWRVRLRVQYLI